MEALHYCKFRFQNRAYQSLIYNSIILDLDYSISDWGLLPAIWSQDCSVETVLPNLIQDCIQGASQEEKQQKKGGYSG